jgi:uncharacterized membrane protein
MESTVNTPPSQPPNQPPNQPPGYPPPGQQPYGYGQPMYGPPPGYAPPLPPSPGSQWGPSSIGMAPNISTGLGYLVPIIAIIFFFMEKQNRFVKFHTAQAILLYLITIVLAGALYVGFFIALFGAAGAGADAETASAVAGLVTIILGLCFGVVILGHLGFWIWGLVASFSGRMAKMPLIGALAERMAGGPVVPVVPMVHYAPPPPPPSPY